MEIRDKSIVGRSADQKPPCHAKGDIASNWIALRYACTSFGQAGPKKMTTKKPVRSYLAAQVREKRDRGRRYWNPEVSDRYAGVDQIGEQTDAL